MTTEEYKQERSEYFDLMNAGMKARLTPEVYEAWKAEELFISDWYARKGCIAARKEQLDG